MAVVVLSCGLLLTGAPSLHGLLVRPEQILADGFKEIVRRHRADRIVVVLEEGSEVATAAAAKRSAALGLPLYGWIEIARNQAIADEHPEWLASVGIHEDWRKRFPSAPRPGKNQVIKAYPWAPIWYRPAFTRQLERVRALLGKNPGVAGVYLNDIQAGPASCGCGNDQCRWAVDYKVAATTEAHADPKTPAEFLRLTRKILPGKPVVPVWCIECEREDQLESRPTTGRCGSVPCFQGLCWKEFTRQFTPIVENCDQIAIPAFQAEWSRSAAFQRDPPWIAPVVHAVRELPPKFGGKPARLDQIVVVIEGWDRTDEQVENQARAVRSLGVCGCIIALTRIHQSWEPRLVDVPVSRRAP